MTEKRRIKIRKIVKGVIEGKTGRQAAIDAGVAPTSAHSRASEIMNSPEGKIEIAAMLNEAGLGRTDVVKELKAGVNKRKYGSHIDYLDRIMDLHGMIDRKKDAVPSVNLFLSFANKIAAEGVIESDGTVRKISNEPEVR